MKMEHNLRSQSSFIASSYQHRVASLMEWLHISDDDYNDTSILERHLSSPSSSSKDSKSFMLLTAVIVSLILTFYAICMFHLIRRYVWRKWLRPRLFPSSSAHTATAQEEAAGATVLVHEGQRYNLSEGQRRAVLEAIFSEASKVRNLCDRPICMVATDFIMFRKGSLHNLSKLISLLLLLLNFSFLTSEIRRLQI
jgi:hypothetical protein